MSFSRDVCEQLIAQKIVEYVELAKALIAVAKKDLEAARVLYRERLYPQAIFYAEQSSEKIAKAFLLTFIIEEVSSPTKCEISTLEDKLKNVHSKFRSIGHDVIKLILETIPYIKNKCEEISKLLALALNQLYMQASTGNPAIEIGGKLKGAIEANCKYIVDLYESLEKDRDKHKVLHEKLREMSKNENELVSFLNEIETVYQVAEYLISILSLIVLSTNIDKSRLLSYVQGLSATSISTLFLLSPHAIRCRYPDFCEDEPSKVCNPLEEYDEKHPLVKNLDRILNLTEKMIGFTELLVSNFIKT